MKRGDYGVDAPSVVRNLAITGIVLLVIAKIFPVVKIGEVDFVGLYWPALGFLAMAGGMLAYSKVAKFNHAKCMVDIARLQGNETVLDVGTGPGLLLVTAAIKLQTCQAIGVDIWNSVDLSGNLRENSLRNLHIEGVDNRCELIDAPAQAMPFPNDSFDVVLSNMCLHNISAQSERDKACTEIANVLKPGGVGVRSNYRNIDGYERVFEQVGLSATKAFFPFATFPPVPVLVTNETKMRRNCIGNV